MWAIVGRSRSTAASRSSVRSHVTQLTMSSSGARGPTSPRPARATERVLDAVRAAETADHDVGGLAGGLEHARAAGGDVDRDLAATGNSSSTPSAW